MGIDIGTSSICGVVCNSSNELIESIKVDNDSPILSANSWEDLQDTTKILDIVFRIVDDTIKKYPGIKGIGVTGQMHGILYADAKGNAVSPLYTWRDSRGNQIYKNNQTYVEYLNENTPYTASSGYGLVTHFHNVINNNVPSNAKKLCTVMDLVTMRLAGKTEPVIDYTNAASLGFFDVKHNLFDGRALERVGLDNTFLPEMSGSAAPIGFYRKVIPIFPAIGDNQASFLGSVKDKNTAIHITIGTGSQISIFVNDYIKVENLELRPFPGGGYILVGAALCGGQSLAILKSFFEDALKLFGEANLGKTGFYEKLNSIEYNCEDGECLNVKTLFGGTRENPIMRGSISNISEVNLTPQNLILGFMRGISQELHDFYEKIPDRLKKEKCYLVGSGNAIKKNDLLVRIIEDQFKLKLHNSGNEEEAAFGACLLAIINERQSTVQ